MACSCLTDHVRMRDARSERGEDELAFGVRAYEDGELAYSAKLLQESPTKGFAAGRTGYAPTSISRSSLRLEPGAAMPRTSSRRRSTSTPRSTCERTRRDTRSGARFFRSVKTDKKIAAPQTGCPASSLAGRTRSRVERLLELVAALRHPVRGAVMNARYLWARTRSDLPRALRRDSPEAISPSRRARRPRTPDSERQLVFTLVRTEHRASGRGQ